MLPLRRVLIPSLALAAFAFAPPASAQSQPTPTLAGPKKPHAPLGRCNATAIEFISPMPGEEVPFFHASPNPDSWHVMLEIALLHPTPPFTGVFELGFIPAVGAGVFPPTDMNGDGVPGDPHPAIPGLTVTMDDDLLFMGFLLVAGTNLASLMEFIGSEIEHGGAQSTSLSWIIDPTYMIIDINGDMGTNLAATINTIGDTVFVRHGNDPLFQMFYSAQTPTITIMTPDWISTVDSDSMPGVETPFLIGIEVRIPCYFDGTTTPPTPIPLDPVFGPCQANTMACTGNQPPLPGPGFNPAFPSLDVRFSDDFMDVTTGTFVPGGVITGGQCGVIWGSTGASLGYAFRQSSVSAWYGVNGFPDTTPLGGGDDQLIYRFTMLVEGMIFDTDALPQEMMITAAVETMSNCFSITNVRVKHRPDVKTPDPGP